MSVKPNLFAVARQFDAPRWHDGGVVRLLREFPYTAVDAPVAPANMVKAEWSLVGPDPEDERVNIYKITYWCAVPPSPEPRP
jgi:hypothetical protein